MFHERRKSTNLSGLVRLQERFDCSNPYTLIDSLIYTLDGLIYDNSDGEIEDDYKTLVFNATLDLLEGLSIAVERGNIKEIHDAIKVRSEEISEFIGESKSFNDLDELFLVMKSKTKEYDIEIHKKIRIEKGAVLYGYSSDMDMEFELFQFHFKPKYMAKIYATCVFLAQQRAEALDNHLDNLARYILELMLVLSSQTKIYNLLKSTAEERKIQELDTIELLTKAPLDYRVNREFHKLFHEVKNDILEGKLPYIREISRAILSTQRDENFLRFTQDDYYISSKASSYRGGKKVYHPSIVSSLCESDPFKGHVMDGLIGYKSGYRESPIHREKLDMITMSIPQSKYKWRIIHLLSNPLQDRGNFIHRRLSNLLKKMRTDCTFNQRRGIQFLEKVTNPIHRDRNNYPTIIGMDFSNATDTLDLQFQLDVLRLVFPEEVVEFWSDISNSKKVFTHHDKTRTEYVQTTGQPQGALGSFVSFALAHHVLILMTMKASGLERKDSIECYRVLGDDNVMSSVIGDPDNILLEIHESHCKSVGFVVNKDKTHVVSSQDKNALVEFAKVTVIDGHVATTVPLKLMTRSAESIKTKIYGRIALYVWMHDNNYQGARQALINTINECFKDPFEKELVFSILGDIYPKLNFGHFVESDMSNIYRFIYIVEKLKGTLLSPFLNDKDSEDMLSSGKTTVQMLDNKLITREGIDPILNDLNPDANHKIWVILEKNLVLREALKSLFDGGEIIPTYELTEDELELIFSISDYLDQYEDLALDEIMAEDTATFKKYYETLKGLDRFMPRSYYKRITREVQFIELTIGKLNELHSKLELSHSETRTSIEVL